MQSSGIGVGQIAQVRGFADQMPRHRDHPEDPSNRRITVIVDASAAVPAPAADTTTAEKGEHP
jgi:chemotaxis protein MotB